MRYIQAARWVFCAAGGLFPSAGRSAGLRSAHECCAAKTSTNAKTVLPLPPLPRSTALDQHAHHHPPNSIHPLFLVRNSSIRKRITLDQACFNTRPRLSGGTRWIERRNSNHALRPFVLELRLNSGPRGEFARLAGAIGKDIQQTTAKLGQLAQLAKRKTLFDDRPVEISELTFIIKQDIANLNQQIAQLQTFVKQNLSSNRGSKQPVDEHNNNVVMMLQSKLADTSLGFKDVLEIRTQNMKATRDRTEQFQFNNSGLVNAPQSVLRSRPTSTLPPTDSPLYATRQAGATSALDRPLYDSKGKGKAAEAGYQQNEYLALDMGANTENASAGGPQGYMQMQLMENNSDAYLQQRSTAIESIESTITELGSIFSQLAQMVAQQGEQVQRIDQDTFDIESNIQSAQSELLKYYSSISGNRMLMLKIFGIIIIFFLLFVLIT
ncbi:hypothetical protein O181_033536 [Austropuccinia psidii MF-1]|uniref:t-SNARE coiled-coil homology domain-containing protein n=1 Tax=Austropuccinia psidii MF-1 TaxID=1389203 RepID=A0A9Q3D4M0_9BASI|nr:hypothetical protein [Austropuccinia psidii MF-1]